MQAEDIHDAALVAVGKVIEFGGTQGAAVERALVHQRMIDDFGAELGSTALSHAIQCGWLIETNLRGDLSLTENGAAALAKGKLTPPA